MANPYKLKREIEQFIINQKQQNPGLSCRGLIPLVSGHFQINLSKSLINKVLKQNSLSSPVGRRREQPQKVSIQPIEAQAIANEDHAEIVSQPVVTQAATEQKPIEMIQPLLTVQEVPEQKPVDSNSRQDAAQEIIDKKPVGIISQQAGAQEVKEKSPALKELDAARILKGGGCFFLKAAELKLSLFTHLANSLASSLSDISRESLHDALEASVFGAIFKEQCDLNLFLGKEIQPEILDQYKYQLEQVSAMDIHNVLIQAGFSYNFNDINELYSVCLQELSSYVQANFFSATYKDSGMSVMMEQFYSLRAQIKSSQGLLEVQFSYPDMFPYRRAGAWQKDLDIQSFYPNGFPGKKEIAWEKELSSAAEKVNQACLFTPEQERIFINPQPVILS